MNILISNVERKSKNGFIIKINYSITKSLGNKSASVYDAIIYTQSNNKFTPFNELTQDDLKSWLNNSLDMAAIEQRLDAEIEEKPEPETLTGLP
jgi:hypothetical protein